MTSKTTTSTIPASTLEEIIANAVASGVAAALASTTVTAAPAKRTRKTPAKKVAAKRPTKAQLAAKAEREAKSEAFVGWVRTTAEARKARQKSNGELAEWMRSKDLLANGPAWEAAKHGERKLSVLRPLDKAHRVVVAEAAAQRKADKAALEA